MERTFLEWMMDFVGFVADVMALIGIGGLLSWGVAKRHKIALADTVISIAMHVYRIGVCALGGLLIFLFGVGFASMIDSLILELILSSLEFNLPSAVRLVASGVISTLFFFPSFLLFCVFVFRWIRPDVKVAASNKQNVE